MKPLIRKIFFVFIAILGGAFSFWMVQKGTIWPIKTKNALCVLELKQGVPKISVPFTTTEKLNRFFIAARPRAGGERLSLAITGDKNFLCSFSDINKPMSFSFSPGEIPQGTYTATLNQETGSHGGRAIIGKAEVGITGWQILSRVLVCLFIIIGLLLIIVRKSSHPRLYAAVFFHFNILLLPLVMIFLYLLFHEGGHALGAALFTKVDWAHSDFWGIHGGPHTGIKTGAQVKPWHLAVISFAGPMMPNFIGWALFLIWRSKFNSQILSRHPLLNIYLTAVIFMSLFPFVAVIGYLSGVITDGDWQGFIKNVPGPLWLAKSFVCGVLLVNFFILWRIVPHFWRALKQYRIKSMII